MKSSYHLGPLCKLNHDYDNTGKSLRRRHGECLECCKIASRKSYHNNKHKYKPRSSYKTTLSETICNQCGKKVMMRPDKIRLKPLHFCNKSCSTTYHNSHKSYGYRRSKLEVWLESNLLSKYPGLEFHFNRTDSINSELDIYVPSLELAFELNGPVHYEPIYGKEKLKRIKNNDNRKFQACLERQIELCIIDVSKIRYFKESTSKPVLDIIVDIINKKLT